jgi:CRP/FNR family transcriptional regulator, cyclic AMP receptor protein
MKNRFEGEAGHRVLIDSLRSQKIVGGNQALAEEIAVAGELIEVTRDTAIIEQGADDNDVYLILT